MTLVDTSVWIGHFRRGNAELQRLLIAGEVATHAMVMGELACGSLHQRLKTLELLGNLPRIPLAPDHMVMEAIERQRLWSRGLGWIDVHLLVASRVSGIALWTLDQRLARLV